jgi:sugar lactone lactonase YvrE
MNIRTAALVLAFAVFSGTLVAVPGPAVLAPSPFPTGMLLVAAPDDHSVWALDSNPDPVTGLPSSITGLLDPEDLAFAPDGSLLVSDGGGDRVVVFDGDGNQRGSIGAGTGLLHPTGLALGPAGHLFVASAGTDRVFEFNSIGLPVGDFGGSTGLADPWGVAIAPDGRIHVASGGTDSVFVFDASGALVDEIGTNGSLQTPRGLCFAGDGHLFVSSLGNDRIVEFDGNGTQVGTIMNAALGGPVGLCFGPDGDLYVASSENDSVLAFSRDGVLAGTLSGFGGVSGVTFTPAVFDATIKYTFQQPGGTPQKAKTSARVCVHLASQTLSVVLGADAGPLALAFGSANWTLHGFAVSENASAKQLSWTGYQVSGKPGDGLASLQLQLKDTVAGGDGDTTAAFGSAVFNAKKFEGDFQRVGAPGISSGTITSKKLLQP